MNFGALNSKISLIEFSSQSETLRNGEIKLHPSIRILKDDTTYSFGGKIID